LICDIRRWLMGYSMHLNQFKRLFCYEWVRCMRNIITQANTYLWHVTAGTCQWLKMATGVASLCTGSGRPTWTHLAAMGISYTEGLGAGKGADIMRATTYWSQSWDLCCNDANCDTHHNSYVCTYTLTTVRSLWCLVSHHTEHSQLVLYNYLVNYHLSSAFSLK
jgi:hypothetical protein